MALVHVIDGGKSLLAAAATVLVCGGPCWFTHLAIQGGLAPVWAYAFVVALGFVGIIMTFAFIRKGFDGVSPSRERRRRG